MSVCLSQFSLQTKKFEDDSIYLPFIVCVAHSLCVRVCTDSQCEQSRTFIHNAIVSLAVCALSCLPVQGCSRALEAS